MDDHDLVWLSHGVGIPHFKNLNPHIYIHTSIYSIGFHIYRGFPYFFRFPIGFPISFPSSRPRRQASPGLRPPPPLSLKAIHCHIYIGLRRIVGTRHQTDAGAPLLDASEHLAASTVL